MDNSISRFKAREQGFILVFEKIFHSEPIEDNISNAEESRDMVVDSYAMKLVNGVYDNLACRSEAREKISRYVMRETGKKPMILPAIVEINTKD